MDEEYELSGGRFWWPSGAAHGAAIGVMRGHGDGEAVVMLPEIVTPEAVDHGPGANCCGRLRVERSIDAGANA
jgi:hypothetical protein